MATRCVTCGVGKSWGSAFWPNWTREVTLSEIFALTLFVGLTKCVEANVGVAEKVSSRESTGRMYEADTLIFELACNDAKAESGTLARLIRFIDSLPDRGIVCAEKGLVLVGRF